MRSLALVSLIVATWSGALLAGAESCCPAGQAAAAEPQGLLMIEDFNEGIQNRLGGYYNKFESSPSTASTFLATDVFRGRGGRSLRVQAYREEEGFCGVWVHFFDFRSEEPKYLDSTGYQYLSFWVKGARGGEDFAIKLADRRWIEKEDSVQIAYASDLLPHGVTTEWQEVLLPLKEMEDMRLDPRQLGGMTLEFMSAGDYTIYLDDISFKTSVEVATPLTEELPVTSSISREYPRAIWVWATDRFLEDIAAREAFFAFCKRDRIKYIWAQIYYAFEPQVSFEAPKPGEQPPATRCVIQRVQETRQFLRAAHEAGLEVHALDGYPEYAQKPYHHAPLAIVDALIAFNRESPPQERFDGIHFDNEPYLLVGWHDWDRRQQILREFLELNAECQRRVREQSEMEFGIDIPFWWQARDPATGRIVGEVEFRGQRKAASYHCIDMLDNVGIMNYRNTADGADGMIAHGKDILEYADRVKQAKVFMGIETFAYRPTQVWFALGLPREAFEQVLQDRSIGLTYLSRVNGFRVQVFDDGMSVHVGIELPESPTQEQQARAHDTVVQIAQVLGASGYAKYARQVPDILRSLKSGASGELEWHDLRRKDVTDPITNREYAAFIATSTMLPKITFASVSFQDLKLQVAAAEDFFGKFESYTGIAIHFDQTYRRKSEATEQEAASEPPGEPGAAAASR